MFTWTAIIHKHIRMGFGASTTRALMTLIPDTDPVFDGSYGRAFDNESIPLTVNLGVGRL